MADTGAALQPFIALSDYKAPAMPADVYLRRILGRVQAMLTRKRAKPFIADDKLKRATMERLDAAVAQPACGPVLAELEMTVAAWCEQPTRTSSVKLIIMPPCDENDVVGRWAHQAGHQVLPPPSRDALIERSAMPLPDLSGDGLLVVPRLEQWFLRHRNGLRVVRALLAALDSADRLVVIGCNSWAWTFLAKSVAADQLLPDPVTFAAFDAQRLHRWLAGLAQAEGGSAYRFRRTQTGDDVLAVDEQGQPVDNFLRMIAGHSFGIPWVAWHLWRDSLRAGDEQPADDAAAMLSPDKDREPGQETLWVAALDEMVLPGNRSQAALLVLQALLIHGALSAEQLRLVLPVVGESNMVPVLVKSGFLTRHGDLFSARPAAYPTIRAGLELAGLPLDAF